jgi:hypothetical protein
MPCASKRARQCTGAAAEFDHARCALGQLGDHRRREFAARRCHGRGAHRIAQPLAEQRPPGGMARDRQFHQGVRLPSTDPPEPPATVDAGVALEVGRDRRGADVLDLRDVGERFGVEAESGGSCWRSTARRQVPGGCTAARSRRTCSRCTSKSAARAELENVGGSQKITS